MQLDTRIPLASLNRRPIRFAPESPIESLTAVAPAINALRGVQQQQMETAEAVRKRQAYQQFQSEVAKAFPNGVKELARVFMTLGTTPQHFEVGQKLMQAAMEEDERQKIFGGGAGGGGGAPAMAKQPAAMPAAAPEAVPEMDFGAAGGARPVNAMMAQTAPAPMGAPAAPAKMLDYAGRQYSSEQVEQMLQSRNPQLQQLGRSIADANKPKTDREFAPSEISRLQQEIAQLPAGDQRRAPLEARIQMLTTRPEPPKVEVQVPVYNPDTKQIEFASREQISRGGLLPTSAKPELPGLNEQQASTATRRLLQRAQEISAVVSRNPSAEAPGVVETAVENLPLISRATNLVRSADRQVVASAQADVLDALLYLATGAAYNKEQLEQQKLAYIPSFSDSSSTRALKRQRLTQMIENAKVRAGRAWSPELDAALNALLESPAMKAAPAAAGRSPAPAPAPAPAPSRAPAAGVDRNNPLLK
jgi:cob(I)alamin adenosyltransferase